MILQRLALAPQPGVEEYKTLNDLSEAGFTEDWVEEAIKSAAAQFQDGRVAPPNPYAIQSNRRTRAWLQKVRTMDLGDDALVVRVDRNTSGTLYVFHSKNVAPFDPDPRQARIRSILQSVFTQMQDHTDQYEWRFAQGAPPTALLNSDGLSYLQSMQQIDVVSLAEMAGKGDGGLGLKATRPDAKTFGNVVARGATWLWLPNEQPLVFWEPETAGVIFPVTVSTPVTALLLGQTAAYRIDGLDPLAVTGQAIHLPGTCKGAGGGEARADRPGEADYIWACDDDTLAAAIGFNPERRVSLQEACPDGFHRVPTPFPGGAVPLGAKNFALPEIRYFKRWKGPGTSKKNKPVDTYPIPPFAYRKADVVADGSASSVPAAATAVSTTALLRKKAKGQWISGSASGRAGVALGGRVSARSGAGPAMKRAYAGFNAAISGSASDFVIDILTHDDVAQARWAADSASVLLRNPDADLVDEVRRLRTDQEWCHLIGQGDGGDESLENFVAGSEHCNTEQLAIENAHRTWRSGLTAKVTAYQWPTEGLIRRGAFRPLEIQFLIDLALVPKKPTLAALTAFRAEWDPASLPEDQTGATGSKTAAARKSASIDTFEKALSPSVQAGLKAQFGARYPRRLESLRQTVDAMFRLPHPMAAAIRYRIYVGETATKAVDYFIDAQRESFDLFQYKMLYYFIRFSIASHLPNAASATGSDAPDDDLIAVHRAVLTSGARTMLRLPESGRTYFDAPRTYLEVAKAQGGTST